MLYGHHKPKLRWQQSIPKLESFENTEQTEDRDEQTPSGKHAYIILTPLNPTFI